MAVKYLSYIVLYDYPAYQDLQDDCITVCGSLSWVSHGFALCNAGAICHILEGKRGWFGFVWVWGYLPRFAPSLTVP